MLKIKLTNKQKAQKLYEWILKLESGTVKQCKNTLCSIVDTNCAKAYSYCCLGVFTNTNKNILDIPQLIKEYLKENDYTLEYIKDFRTYLLSSNVLNESVADEFGFFGSLGDVDNREYASRSLISLAELNDKGHSFKDIATTLRKHPDQYFRKHIAFELKKILKTEKVS